MSLDGFNTVTEYDRPMLTYGKDQRLMSINGGDYFITDNHPVMTTEGWKAYMVENAKSEAWDILNDNISQLLIGDEIISSDGSTILVESIDIRQKNIETFEDVKLYNFVLDGDHTYYTNDMLVIGFVPDEAGVFPIERDH